MSWAALFSFYRELRLRMCKEFAQDLTASHLRVLDMSILVYLPRKPAGFPFDPLRGQKKHTDQCPAQSPPSSSPFPLNSPSVSRAEPALGVFAFSKSHLYPDTFTGSPMPSRKLYRCLLNLYFLIKLRTRNPAPRARSYIIHNSYSLFIVSISNRVISSYYL